MHETLPILERSQEQAQEVQTYRRRSIHPALDGSGRRDYRTRISDITSPTSVYGALAGLLDGDRPGRPPTYGHDDVLLLVKTVTEDPPDGATRWTMEALAARMAEEEVPISPSQAWRICRALDLKPWQVQSWMTSHDPEFWAKAGDVCGLYLNPPQNALVWSVDEKTGIQAKSRINPTRRHVVGEDL